MSDRDDAPPALPQEARMQQPGRSDMTQSNLLSYYEAIEQASAEMLAAARAGNWDQVVKLEGACVLLISQLKHAARGKDLAPDEAQLKSRIMQRILVNDAEIRTLAEPWLDDIDQMLEGRPRLLH